jgi:hypothetical protein
MNKNLVTKTITSGLIISTIVNNTGIKAEACDSAAVLELAKEASIACPYAAPLFITGAAVIVTATTVIGIKQDNTKEEVIYRSYTHLPDRWRPGSVVEKINPRGQCIQRRFYDSKGLPLMDVDLGDHGMPEAHPFGHGGCHKHLYNHANKRKPRQRGIELTDEEYQKYVKDFDRSKADRMKVRYIED